MTSRRRGGEDKGESVSVRVRDDNGEYDIEAKKLIIAEGVNCKLTEIFGLNENRAFFGTPLICNYTLTKLNDAKVIKKTACGVKSYISLAKPYKGNVMSIGDSAAHIEVINQGAIMCGYHAAAAVRDELAGEDGFEKYTAWWNDAFEFNCDDPIGHIKMYGVINIKRTLSDDELDYVFSLLEGQRQCGHFDQYEVPKNFWRAVLSHDDIIKRDNAALYDKLSVIRQLKEQGAI